MRREEPELSLKYTAPAVTKAARATIASRKSLLGATSYRYSQLGKLEVINHSYRGDHIASWLRSPPWPEPNQVGRVLTVLFIIVHIAIITLSDLILLLDTSDLAFYGSRTPPYHIQ
jgi:hypothetical protein